MGRKGIAFLIVFTMLCSVIFIVIEIAPNVKGLTIYVDDDYGSEDPTHKKTIVSAIENASNGDTIIVYDGEYNGKFGEIYIDKSVDIIGESIESTIINSTWLHFGINYVNLSYFKIQGCTVDIGGVSNIKFNYCNFTSFSSLDIYSTNVWLLNSSIIERGYLWTHSASYVYIDNVYMNNTQYPLWISSSSNIFITNSILSYLDDWGVYPDQSTNIVMKNTAIYSDEGGIGISWGSMSEPSYYNHSIDTTNTVNGKPVYYYFNKTNLILSNLEAGHITIALCSNITIKDSNVTGGDGINLVFSSDINISKNNVSSTFRTGIYLINSANNNLIKDNFISYNTDGIALSQSTENRIINNTICFNKYSGLGMVSSSENNSVLNCNVTNNKWGILVRTQDNVFSKNLITDNWDKGIWLLTSDSKNNLIVNNSLRDNNLEFSLNQDAYAYVLNTTFNKTRVGFELPGNAQLIIQWFLHVKVIDDMGNPVSSANVKIEDNKNGTYNETLITDGNGYVKWIPVTEYIQRSTGKTFYTPHEIMAWNNTLIGYAQPVMNESKTITIILGNGTFMDLEPGWNLVSLPRIQSDTNIITILQSIEEDYDSVQRYNITDNNDHWKHYHVSKPSYLNDLDSINHTMGFWLHVTNAQGAKLLVFGDELALDQHIPLNPGWNLVGFPSRTNNTRDVALAPLNFGNDVDSIWTFNSTSQKWVELDDSMDYFEVGKGYWIHSKVTKTWIVPH